MMIVRNREAKGGVGRRKSKCCQCFGGHKQKKEEGESSKGYLEKADREETNEKKQCSKGLLK